MPQSQTIHVSVVVPCRNEIRHIRAFLDSVLRQELGRIEMEVLIADGMSDDGTRLVLDEFERRFAAIRVLDNPEKIVSTALNRAIREARGEIIIRMDAHTTYAPDYVRSCVEVLHETNADNVGGPALTRADGYIAQAIALAFHTPFASGGAKFRDPRYEGPVDTVTYGCWRKSTLERIGLFDEKLVRGQDYELNVRILSCGGTVWQSPKNHFLVLAQGQPFRAVLAILSVRVLESCRGSQASEARILAKSRAGFLLARRSRFAALRRCSEPRRIDLVARNISCGLVYVGRPVFHRIFRDGLFCREAGRVVLSSLLAHRFCHLPFVLRARFCSGAVVSSRDRGPRESYSESPYGHHKIIFHPRFICAGIARKKRQPAGGYSRGPARISAKRFPCPGAEDIPDVSCGVCLTRFAHRRVSPVWFLYLP